MHTTHASPDHTPQTVSLPTDIHTAHDPWAMETLLKKALTRTKSRFLSVLLSSLLTMLVTSGVLLVSALLIGIPLFAFSAASQYGIVVLIGAIGLIGIIIVTMYVSVWGQLATVHLIVNEPPRDVIGAWQHVRPHVKRAFVALTTMSLFLFGLLPISFISLFIPLIAWNFLFGFTLFIIISTHKSASNALWTSKDMILTKFWGIAGRVALMLLLVQFVSLGISLVSVLFVGDSANTGGAMSVLSNLISIALSFLVAPYTLAFLYEMYQLIPVPHTSKTPHKWIVASAIGVVVMAIGIVSMISFASTIDWKGVSTKMGGIINEQRAKKGDRYGRNLYKDVDIDTTMPQYDAQ